MDLIGINNVNEYYSNYYFASIFAENAAETISGWRARARNGEYRAPWSRLRDCARQYYVCHDREMRGRGSQIPAMTREMAGLYLAALDYPQARPTMESAGGLSVPVYQAVNRANGAPLLWIMLAQGGQGGAGVLEGQVFSALFDQRDAPVFRADCGNEELAGRILFGMDSPPRWLMFIGLHQIVLIDRRKWGEKRYLSFELGDIFSRKEDGTLQAMAVLLHRESLCPEEGDSLLDQLDENSHRHASGVSQDLKYALRESVELLGNEVLYDLSLNRGRDLDAHPVDAGELTIQCMRYMYRMLFVLFIEARPELGYAPMKAQAYVQSYSLESLRDIADTVREEIDAVGEGFYLHETLSKLYRLIYEGYPASGEELRRLEESGSQNDIFVIPPLKAHIFDPELTPMITSAKLRNKVMLRIIDLMSVTRPSGRSGERRGRISYSTLGINQLGAVYEALLSYRGFIAKERLFEVKRRQDSFNELEVGYFVPESRLPDYDGEERVRYESGPDRGKLRKYEKGEFIYRLAGREREKSASFYTPETLTKCLVKYALKELLEGKTADEILHLTICEPAMGSAAFLNEAINQMAEAYLERKQRELGTTISHEKRFEELQRVKMYIADRNVYGVDLNPVAVELAEVSLWLNTIFSGGFVPWFGTQIVCGNALIGARRQCYTAAQLQATGARWYESAPRRVPVGKGRAKHQIYHFLAGDPGMAGYKDKVIRALEPDKIKAIKAWNKKFTAPFSDGDIQIALNLSRLVDELWKQVVQLRRRISEQTSDPLLVYGQPQSGAAGHTTIREKDMIYQKLYLSRQMRNAGPYARLKFAMDYWCALWFWPISQAELLPSRSEYLSDMSFILEGTIGTFAAASPQAKMGQTSLFPLTEVERLMMDRAEQFGGRGVVDIPELCRKQPRLALVRQIAQQNRFMHWELEFADLFEDRGGFDLILGNPPWVKLTWEEKGVLSDEQPLFAIRSLTAAQTTQRRDAALSNPRTRALYFAEYESIAAQQSYINARQNYPSLRGLQGNLYECFLPQSWTYANGDGIFALIHPESVFNDSKGVDIREQLNARLRKHFRFSNALKLFPDVHTSREFGLNVYSNRKTASFEQIVNLCTARTVDECYENENSGPARIRDEDGRRSLKGQRSRVTQIGQKELALFARILDGGRDWRSARLLSVYTEELLEVLKCFDQQRRKLADLGQGLMASMLWDETNAQKNGSIAREVHFGPLEESILSGAHIGTANPLFNCPNANCTGNNDNTSVDLAYIPPDYIPRTNYIPRCTAEEYQDRVPFTPWDTKYTQEYRLACRKMVDIQGERTLMAALIPPMVGHTNGIIGFAFASQRTLLMTLGAFCSLPFDFFIKVCGKGNLQMNTAGMLPLLDEEHPMAAEILCRTAVLNCLTQYYSDFWSRNFRLEFQTITWTKKDPRLNNRCFAGLSKTWSAGTPLRTAYARRQALVELDVLAAMMLGMTLDQLLSVYQIQFPTLQQHERDTYYDANGGIVFAKNNALTGVGVKRQEFESRMKDAPAGTAFGCTSTDNTLPGGPVERMVEYLAPFDRCDRERDYKTAWRFFSQKYGMI
ncbi:MAG: class I SAM-dependent DNA methyltransferase [Lawsonibacter sp.]|nr:class I SAM-dependent DNA methyltransferase [Lawsonibacter sp.]